MVGGDDDGGGDRCACDSDDGPNNFDDEQLNCADFQIGKYSENGI